MRVYFVQGDQLCGPVAYREIEGAIEEVRMHLSDESAVGHGVRIVIGEMTEEEYAALPEFEGY